LVAIFRKNSASLNIES